MSGASQRSDMRNREFIDNAFTNLLELLNGNVTLPTINNLRNRFRLCGEQYHHIFLDLASWHSFVAYGNNHIPDGDDLDTVLARLRKAAEKKGALCPWSVTNLSLPNGDELSLTINH